MTSNATGSESNHRPRIGLALGSGSARGLAHLGVIRAIEDAGIKIDFIADTLALTGAIHAADKLDELEAAFRASGAGWQTRMNAALRDWLKKHPSL